MLRAAGASLPALGVCVAAAHAEPQSPGRTQANTMTFHDEAGEDVAAPDITTVTVSNDVRDNVIFRVLIPNRERLTDEMRVGIRIDSGEETAVGGAREYDVHADRFGPHLFHCANPPTCDVFVGDDPRVVRFSCAGGATFKIGGDALGSTKSFAFAVEAWDGLEASRRCPPGREQRGDSRCR